MDKIVYEGQWLNCLMSPNGWEYVSRKPFATYKDGNTKPDAVVIVPMKIGQFGENELVMIKEYRSPIGDFTYGFPAGLIDHDETAEEAAIRELKEETGLTVKNVFGITPPIFSSEGLTDECVSIVYVTVEGEVSTKFQEENEDIKTLVLNETGVQKLLSNPDLKFSKIAWMAATVFANTGSLDSLS